MTEARINKFDDDVAYWLHLKGYVEFADPMLDAMKKGDHKETARLARIASHELASLADVCERMRKETN